MAFWFWFALGVDLILVPLAIASVLRSRREPTAMLAWVVAIIAFPFIGIVLYILLGENRVRRRAERRRRRDLRQIAEYVRWSKRSAPVAAAADLDPELAQIEQISRKLALIPAVGGNEVTCYAEAEATYGALEAAIHDARHHLHLEYYIWQPDQTGRHFRDLLIAAARRGVEVRVLLDAVGSWKLGRSFLAPLTDAGVRVSMFLPILGTRRRWSPHLRNHRKLVVADGHTAFLGSQNIGDEYRGRLKKLSPWYDSHIRIRGPAATLVQQVFAEDWLFSAHESLLEERYFQPPPARGSAVVQIVPTGPDSEFNVLTQILFAAVSAARDSIQIATPYFVPDPATAAVLQYAAHRGVRVRLVIPTRTDAKLVLWAGRSFYPELVQAGVEIREYDSGVVHSKIATIDDRWSLLTSANMDIRSFRLNFEITALIYDASVSRELAGVIARYCSHARAVGLREVYGRSLGEQLLIGGARLFSPLL